MKLKEFGIQGLVLVLLPPLLVWAGLWTLGKMIWEAIRKRPAGA